MNKIDQMKNKYPQMVEKVSPQNTVLGNSIRAFWVGGVICMIGQFITNNLINLGLTQDESAAFTSVILIFLGAALTALSIYDEIGKYAGGGSAIPITGFANSMVSAAVEYKAEGYVFGLGAKIFTIAGPVIVYGIISSTIIGIIYYFIG